METEEIFLFDEDDFWGKKYLLTDSRQMTLEAESIFFALRGKRFNGHDFIEPLIERGVKHFVVDENPPCKTPPDVRVKLVPDTVRCLQELVAHHRMKFDIPVIGITGSNGKTIVKEWLYLLLSQHYSVVKSPKSYNSQIGVPLSVWKMTTHNEIGIFEAGISQAGEMHRLEPVIRPTIGIFTNIGSAHSKGFASEAEKIHEKLRLFKNSKVLIYRRSYKELDKHAQQLASSTFTWSMMGTEADVVFGKMARNRYMVHYPQGKFVLTVPFKDAASIENLFHCITLMLYLKMPENSILNGMKKLVSVPMRLELKNGKHDCLVVNDSYNNDEYGLEIALDFQSQHAATRKKIVILSDILEASSEQEMLYKSIARVFHARGIHQFIGIGHALIQHEHLFSRTPHEVYPDTQSFLDQFKFNTDWFQSIILVKGARTFGFERITARLQRRVHGTLLEINLDALASNLDFYRSKISSQTKIMVMVKAFSYGSGSYEIAHLLERLRVDYLAVAYTDEGVVLRQNGIRLPIMVLNPSPDSFEQLWHYGLEPEIYSAGQLQRFISFIKRRNIQETLQIHLLIDTGMHRLGWEEKHYDELFEHLKDVPFIEVATVFTHLAAAEDAQHDKFTQTQLDSFQRFCARYQKELGYTPMRHILNSSGIIKFPAHQLEMVRLGIGLYGYDPTGLYQHDLRQVSTLRTTISQIKHLSKGESVGYGRIGKVEKACTIGTLAIGYADGFDRRLGQGRGYVLVNGQKAHTVGNICMDMCMVDVSGLDVEEEDEVIVFGDNLPVHQLVKDIGTIPYEMMTGIGERVKRVFYLE